MTDDVPEQIKARVKVVGGSEFVRWSSRLYPGVDNPHGNPYVNIPRTRTVNPYVDMPRMRPVFTTTGLAKQIFAAAGLLVQSDAARPESTDNEGAACQAWGVPALAAIMMLVAFIGSGAPWKVRAGIFVALATLGQFVEAIAACQFWQFAFASMFFALVWPRAHVKPRTREAGSQTSGQWTGEAGREIRVFPREVTTATGRGTRYHLDPYCYGLREAREMKTYTPCKLCSM